MSATTGPGVRVPRALPLTSAGRRVVDAVLRAGGRPYLVGGSVRDLLAGGADVSKDLDVEVFDLDLDALVEFGVQRLLDGFETVLGGGGS